MNIHRETSPVSREEFDKLLDAYVGARLHEDWANDFASMQSWTIAKKASADARDALVRAVFP